MHFAILTLGTSQECHNLCTYYLHLTFLDIKTSPWGALLSFAKCVAMNEDIATVQYWSEQVQIKHPLIGCFYTSVASSILYLSCSYFGSDHSPDFINWFGQICGGLVRSSSYF